MMTDDSNFFFGPVPRIIVIGDVHGDLGRLTATLKAIGVMSVDLDWIAEPRNTVVVQLGDQLDSIDRTGASGGTEGDGVEPAEAVGTWEKSYDMEVVLFMDRLDQVARRSGGRVISLLGNHEMMNVSQDFSYVSKRSMERSGGAALRGARLAPGGTWARILARRPVVCKIGRNLFCHGGILPWHIVACHGNIQVLNGIVSKWLTSGPSALCPQEQFQMDTCVMGQEGILWTRNYLDLAMYAPDKMPEVIDKVLDELGASAIYVGHNTVSQITGAMNGKVWFMDAQFSRSYGSQSVQVLDIRNDGELIQRFTIGA